MVKVVEIAWPAGVERIAIDINHLNEMSSVWRTVQHIDESAKDYHYEATLTCKKLPDERFEIKLRYDHGQNQHIDIDDSWWGTTTLVVKKGDRSGIAVWNDENYKENNSVHKFRTVSSTVKEDGRLGKRTDDGQDEAQHQKFTQQQTSSAKTVKPLPKFVVGQQYWRAPDIHDHFGGSRQSGISPSAVSNAIFIFTGDSGEQHGYKDFEEVDEDGCRVFHYCGEGQVGDMTLTRGNLAISRHSIDGKAIHLFKSLGKSKPVQYLGEYIYLDHYPADGEDRGGQNRQIIVFKLVRSDDLSVLDGSVQPDEAENETSDLATARLLALAAVAAQKEGGQPTKGSRNLYVRSRRVRDYVLLRANGKCELCATPAPFLKPDGTPYLEPHHTTRVSDGGPDHPLHVGALCPSCHREIHFGQKGAQRNAELQARLREIEKV